MKRPRTYYGWEADGKFKVSLWPRDDPRCRGADSFDTKDDAIRECVKKRTDALGRPVIEWETPGG